MTQQITLTVSDETAKLIKRFPDLEAILREGARQVMGHRLHFSPAQWERLVEVSNLLNKTEKSRDLDIEIMLEHAVLMGLMCCSDESHYFEGMLNNLGKMDRIIAQVTDRNERKVSFSLDVVTQLFELAVHDEATPEEVVMAMVDGFVKFITGGHEKGSAAV